MTGPNGKELPPELASIFEHTAEEKEAFNAHRDRLSDTIEALDGLHKKWKREYPDTSDRAFLVAIMEAAVLTQVVSVPKERLLELAPEMANDGLQLFSHLVNFQLSRDG
tara:strand:+ start:1482 stop:1808 length:327 start_codon:yes stop_codon:yes gene_type:complete